MSARSSRRALAVLAAAVLTVSLLTTSAAGARIAAPELAGLGDSYSSGLGTGTYYEDSGSCKRSPDAYPVLDSERIGAALTFVACSGATTADVESDQLSALSSSTTDVTMTVGGNDIGFADVITTCALPSWAGDCFGAIRAARALITGVLPGSLDTLYGDIAAQAPNATVVIVGYPHLFNGEDCDPATFFTPAEEKALNAATNLLDKTIKKRAGAAGFAFANPRKAFQGHAICDDVPWINGLTFPIDESFHPNVLGQQGYADVVAKRL
jgi:hypothetical protein